MLDPYAQSTGGTAREQELELEVARLEAELDALRGADPGGAVTRLLSMAAETIDRTVEEARREADELAEEISAAAEARRDEATRLAAEAEAEAERLREEAAHSQEILDEAQREAEAIRLAAVEEAGRVAAEERARVMVEIERLTEVRTALEQERALLDGYHDELTRRVQDMAESMMAFMTLEPPMLDGGGSASSNAPELAALADANETDTPENDSAEPGSPGTPQPEIDPNDQGTPAMTTDIDEPTPQAEEPLDDPAFTAALAEAIGADADELAAAEQAAFAGVPVVDDPLNGAVPVVAAAGVFDSASDGDEDGDEGGEERSAHGDDAGDGEGDGGSSLFGLHGARLIEQAPPDQLAAALDDESEESDEAFREFLDGDGEPDPSRDWLLRPE